jgi:large subunit ribosomal protein L25
MAVQLKAAARKDIKAKNLIRKGEIPGIVYGPGRENIKVQISESELLSLVTKAKETTPVHIVVDVNGKNEERDVFIKTVQIHKVTGKIIHIDLYEPDPQKEMKFRVPIKFTGEAEGIKAGGIFDELMRDVDAETLPANIIEEIVFDVSKLKLGESIRVKDLTVPQNVKLLVNPESVVAVIKAPRAEEIVSPAAEAVESAEPEAIKAKGKKEEEGQEEEKKS